MNLTVKITDAKMGTVVALCDEAGKMLPGQVAATLESAVNDAPYITVTFRVDGKSVRLVPAD